MSTRSPGRMSAAEAAMMAVTPERKHPLMPTTRCCGMLLRRILRSDDSSLTVLRKVMSAYGLIVALVLGSIYMLTQAFGQLDRGYIGIFYSCQLLLHGGGFLAYMLISRNLPNWMLQCGLYSFAAIAVVSDYLQRINGSGRGWGPLILLVDWAVLLDFSNRTLFQLLIIAVLSMVVLGIEDVFRFGLYDMPGTMAYADRLQPQCEKPPCAASYPHVFDGVPILLVHYWTTSGYKKTALQEQDKLRKAEVFARKIAQDLVAFDLDAAREGLNDASVHLSPDLYSSFTLLLNNLKLFRPYIPDALFEETACLSPTARASIDDSNLSPRSRSTLSQSTSESFQLARAPGIENQIAAVAFTDIRNSTGLWHACSAGMAVALREHNRIIRYAAKANKGYEVKTIGDAFMVSFPDVRCAVAFGCGVHEGLLTVDYPSSLLALPACTPAAGGLWRGLCVRIGIDYGPVSPEFNPVSSRWDYFGTTVNRAARLESACTPGAIAVATDVLLDAGLLPGSRSPGAGEEPAVDYAVISEHDITLKGFESGDVSVTCLVPRALEGRRDHPYEVLQDSLRRVVNINIRPTVECTSVSSSDDADASQSLGSSMAVAHHNHSGRDTQRASSDAQSTLLARLKSGLHSRAVLHPIRAASVAVVTKRWGVSVRDDTEQLITDVAGFTSQLMLACQRTGGTVQTFYDRTAVVLWGTCSKQAGQHLEDSYRFTQLLKEEDSLMQRDRFDRERIDRDAMSSSLLLCGVSELEIIHPDAPVPSSTAVAPFAIGLSSGPMHSGTVGGASQRYVTIVGKPVLLASRFCLMAIEADVTMLCGSVDTQHAHASVPGLRRLHLHPHGDGETVIDGTHVPVYTHKVRGYSTTPAGMPTQRMGSDGTHRLLAVVNE